MRRLNRAESETGSEDEKLAARVCRVRSGAGIAWLLVKASGRLYRWKDKVVNYGIKTKKKGVDESYHLLATHRTAS